MKEILPFNENPECPKCQTMSPRLEFCWLTDGREYLKVTCEECGYHWNMETADSGKKELILEEEKPPEKFYEETEEGMKAKEDDGQDTRLAPVEGEEQG